MCQLILGNPLLTWMRLDIKCLSNIYSSMIFVHLLETLKIWENVSEVCGGESQIYMTLSSSKCKNYPELFIRPPPTSNWIWHITVFKEVLFVSSVCWGGGAITIFDNNQELPLTLFLFNFIFLLNQYFFFSFFVKRTEHIDEIGAFRSP